MVSCLDNCDDIQSTDSVIDIGCGNGMMLIELVCKYYDFIHLTKKNTFHHLLLSGENKPCNDVYSYL